MVDTTAKSRTIMEEHLMTVSAHDVAAEIRRQMPEVGVLKLHKLLYYSQCYHLAWFGVPLFAETVSAWDNGPVVGELWYEESNNQPVPEPVELGNRELNTVGFVLSRYGALSGQDLVDQTHAEDPWQRADKRRPSHGSSRIEPAWMRDFVRSQEEPHGLAESALRAYLAEAATYRGVPGRADTDESLEALRARYATA